MQHIRRGLVFIFIVFHIWLLNSKYLRTCGLFAFRIKHGLFIVVPASSFKFAFPLRTKPGKHLLQKRSRQTLSARFETPRGRCSCRMACSSPKAHPIQLGGGGRLVNICHLSACCSSLKRGAMWACEAKIMVEGPANRP